MAYCRDEVGPRLVDRLGIFFRTPQLERESLLIVQFVQDFDGSRELTGLAVQWRGPFTQALAESSEPCLEITVSVAKLPQRIGIGANMQQVQQYHGAE